ncbi:hypothetical protein CCP2SC5_630018 [Azospirillaceae bacterium]
MLAQRAKTIYSLQPQDFFALPHKQGKQSAPPPLTVPHDQEHSFWARLAFIQLGCVQKACAILAQNLGNKIKPSCSLHISSLKDAKK